jgi:hypothetical protein
LENVIALRLDMSFQPGWEILSASNRMSGFAGFFLSKPACEDPKQSLGKVEKIFLMNFA